MDKPYPNIGDSLSKADGQRRGPARSRAQGRASDARSALLTRL